MQTCDWRDVYEIIQYCAHHLPPREAQTLVDEANRVLEREKSAWQFIGRDLVRRIADREVKALADAWADSQPLLRQWVVFVWQTWQTPFGDGSVMPLVPLFTAKELAPDLPVN